MTRQIMRMVGSSGEPAQQEEAACRKVVHNASSKVSLVVHKMLFPLLDTPMRTHVVLDTEADQVELDLLDQVGRHKPALMEDEQGLLRHLQSLLERYRRRQTGPRYAQVPTA
jgi:hypothetical protein